MAQRSAMCNLGGVAKLSPMECGDSSPLWDFWIAR